MRCPSCGTINTENEGKCACGCYLAAKTEPAAPAVSQVRRLSFHGNGGGLFGNYIRKLLLSLVTFGIYYFWGKVEVRKYLYSQHEFEGDRFAYHGTGKEIFIGWLKAALLFGALSAGSALAGRLLPEPGGAVLRAVILYGGLL